MSEDFRIVALGFEQCPKCKSMVARPLVCHCQTKVKVVVIDHVVPTGAASDKVIKVAIGLRAMPVRVKGIDRVSEQLQAFCGVGDTQQRALVALAARMNREVSEMELVKSSAG